MATVDHDAVIRRLRSLSSEALADMLRKRDTRQWREEVFQIAERLLAERTGTRPAVAAPPAAAPTTPIPVVIATRPLAAPKEPAHESPVAFDEARADAIAIHCSDGRFNEHLEHFLSEKLQIPRCDQLAVPGGAALLAGRLAAFWESSGVENQVHFLVEAHALKRVVLIAHEGCGYYARKLGFSPATIDQAQLEDLGTAARRLARLADGLQVSAFMIRRPEDQLVFEPVSTVEHAAR